MNVNVIFSRMEVGTDSAVIPCDDGSYTIQINKHLSQDKQIQALLHEVGHIQGDDFAADEHASLLEAMVRERDVQDLDDINFFYHVV